MQNSDFIKNIVSKDKANITELSQPYSDEVYLTVSGDDFAKASVSLHKELNSPVMMFFAEDLRSQADVFTLYNVFLNSRGRSWVVLRQDISADNPFFSSIAKDIYSASLFEREIKEMFGIEPLGNPDLRRLRLHNEIWPEGFYPLRKDFKAPGKDVKKSPPYIFRRVEGVGVFEVPVGPVHAGIIGPGHFRFSVAGEPIINLEKRLGWTHRGIEKLLEGMDVSDALGIFERVSGDTAFGYSLAFCLCAEKILRLDVPLRAQLLRVIFLELERIYNHANDMGGIALDVGFSFPAQFASLIKEAILRLNDELSASRYLKSVNCVGGVNLDIAKDKQELLRQGLIKINEDFLELEKMLYSSISFMDRVDSTGALRTKTARDLGITGLAARASGIPTDMRKILYSVMDSLPFELAKEQSGDCLARLKVRFSEVRESANIINQCLARLAIENSGLKAEMKKGEGFGIGCAEAWRGPVRVWMRLDKQARIERCKIVDPSFHNWEGLTFAVLGNIIPDFPLCNKSFDLSYSGNDL